MSFGIHFVFASVCLFFFIYLFFLLPGLHREFEQAVRVLGPSGPEVVPAEEEPGPAQ